MQAKSLTNPEFPPLFDVRHYPRKPLGDIILEVNTMFFDFTVIIPDVKGKIVRKKRADTTYVNYEYDRVYLPEKQYTIPKRTTIGKVCDEDSSLMYP